MWAPNLFQGLGNEKCIIKFTAGGRFEESQKENEAFIKRSVVVTASVRIQ